MMERGMSGAPGRGAGGTDVMCQCSTKVCTLPAGYAVLMSGQAASNVRTVSCPSGCGRSVTIGKPGV